MSALALRLEGVSKRYRLGEVGTGTLGHDMNRLWARIRGRPDPGRVLGEEDETGRAGNGYVWALKDIDLEVGQEEILGIIGRNGAGKSTLLKLLSRVTGPTTGEIRINGRIASLLEVGTGFHPELTGRENIYLNGAILGMSRAEITAKLDEIVDFSGCGEYLDTPVKRYSSGMHVRLAFAVAAHLEPDILIVDEVLAVGDAEFQARCLGKMQDVSRRAGRTVLFVSHNMGSVRQLCPRAILLERGALIDGGASHEVVERYLSSRGTGGRVRRWAADDAPRSRDLVLHRIAVLDEAGRHDSELETASAIRLSVDYEVVHEIRNMRIVATVRNVDGTDVFSTSDYAFQGPSRRRPPGRYSSTCHIPGGLMTTGNYVVTLDFEIPFERLLLDEQHVAFEISHLSVNQLGATIARRPPGAVHPLLDWTVERS